MPVTLRRVKTYNLDDGEWRRVQREQMKIKTIMKRISSGGGKARAEC